MKQDNKKSKSNGNNDNKIAGKIVGNAKGKTKTAIKGSSKKTNVSKAEAQKESQKKRFSIAQKFANEILKEFKQSLKVVAVYGSTAKGKHKKTSDIDVFVVIDDTKIESDVPMEVKDRIQRDLYKIAGEIDKNITIQYFVFLTEFWESLRSVQPILMHVLNSGIPVYDVGVFMPAKRMLQRGLIPATKESVAKRLYTAPQLLDMARTRVTSAAHSIEQAMASAGQAPLMQIGKVAVGKEDIGRTLNELFVKKGVLEKKYADDATAIHKFAKEVEMIEDDEKKCVGIGKRMDEYLDKTKKFIERMKKLTNQLDEDSKTKIIMKTYKTFLKANIGALELIGVEPPEELKDLSGVMGKKFPDLKDDQKDLFERIAKAVIVSKKGKADIIPEGEIYGIREETKRFIYNLGNKLKELKKDGKIKLPDDFDETDGKSGEEKNYG